MDSNSLIFILLFIIIGMLTFLYYDNINRESQNKTSNSVSNNSNPVEVIEYNPYIYYNPYYYDGYPWWWYGSSGGGNYYSGRRIYYGGHRDGYSGHRGHRIYTGHGGRGGGGGGRSH